MFINDLVLSKVSSRNDFLKGCLPLDSWQESFPEYAETKAILDKAQNSGEFISMILNSDTMRGTQIYAELSKDQPDHWKRIMNDLDTWHETYSDAGGLRIGNDDFSVIVPNGYGDGNMHYTIVGRGCFNHDMLNFWCSISGKNINIYNYDCSDGSAVNSLSGRYGVFYGYGFVVFEKWD